MPIHISLRAITPKRLPTIDMQKVARELRDEIGRFAKQDIQEAFESTVATWKTSVKFTPRFFVTADEISVRVSPSGDPGARIWGYLEEGTRAHWVAPRKASALRFRTRYQAKTSPGLVGSGPGGGSGPFAFSRGHRVRGIVARKWTWKIARRARAEYRRQVEKALRRSAK